jgi:hypothetical protein
VDFHEKIKKLLEKNYVPIGGVSFDSFHGEYLQAMYRAQIVKTN